MSIMLNMTTDLFMERIKENVRNAAIDGTVLQLKKPSGRKPRRSHVEQSEWFNQLAEDDRDMIAAIMQEVVDEALFGLFAVLDSVRTIDDDFEEEGQFELFYINNGVKTQLNDPDTEDLHVAYNAITNDRVRGVLP